MSGRSTDVWTRYWASSGGARGGCLPNAGGPVEAAQRQVWQDFAGGLPRRARVLDLAAGNGIVGGWMAAARPDLKLIGVDSAVALPPPPRGVTLKAGVALERLPFADASFGAATSQFGIEYGEAGAAAAELARVLSPGAPLLLVVHHQASPIVAHNLARREALRWAAGPAGLLPRAKAFAGTGGLLPVPPAFRSAPQEARRLFPAQSVAAEFALGILQRLELVRDRGGAAVQALLGAMEEDAAGEIGRIDLLEQAARDAAGAAALAAALTGAGLAMEAPRPLLEPQGARPLAWLLAGCRLRP